MSGVIRYILTMEQSPFGQYVAYHDYALLEARAEARERALLSRLDAELARPKIADAPSVKKREWALREAGNRCAASLVAALWLLRGGGKKAAASDTMFAQMLIDYQSAVDAWRALGEQA